ncbi:hypothetical protein [Methylobacterium sp.]|jgi:hypothetical protein|uniref:hypothetical protein n=1 Tax=Methylobacterium sp. TaxID=409 RepID=UPI00257E8907|nr:hypothetical protein [Methylobacterium sp.]
MITAEEAREAVRPPLSLLVNHQVEQGAARMQAYGRVASLIGRSSAWVQRVIGRDPRAAVGLHDAANIRAAYDRLCARVQADNDRLDNELAELLGDVRAHAPAPASTRQRASSGPARRRADLRFRRAPLIPVSALAAA